MLRKVIALILASCMVLGTLAGCKGKEPQQPKTPPDANVVADPTTTPDATTTMPDTNDPAGTDSTDNITAAPDDGATTAPDDMSTLPEGTPTDPTAPDNATDPTIPTAPVEGETDPWALTPAPTIESLLQEAFPSGKTIHATMSMNLSMKVDEGMAAMLGSEGDVAVDDIIATMYLNTKFMQDADTVYADGTVTSYATGENTTAVQRSYGVKGDGNTITTYTFDPENNNWVQAVENYTGSFGLDSMVNFTGTDADLSTFEMETTDTDYVITGARLTDVSSMLGSVEDLAGEEGTGDPAPALVTNYTIRIDKTTHELRSIIAVVESFTLLFFNIPNMTMAISDVYFDDMDVAVPADVINGVSSAP